MNFFSNNLLFKMIWWAFQVNNQESFYLQFLIFFPGRAFRVCLYGLLLWLISIHHHFHLCYLVNHKPLRGTDQAIMISRGFFKCRLQKKFVYCGQRFPGGVRSRTVFTEGSLTLCSLFIDYKFLWPAYLTLCVISYLACLLETWEALCEMKAT